MNIIDIVLLAILLFSLLAGAYKGFIASGLATAGIVGSWFGAQKLYERVANFALSNKSFMAFLSQYLEADSFFSGSAIATQKVTDIVAGGDSAIGTVVNQISDKLSYLADAFENNIRTLAFEKLGISTVAEYLDQTIWESVFHVLAFILTFIILYWVVMLVVNLLDHVFRFGKIKGIDWLLGALFGFARGLIICTLILAVLPMLMETVVPDLAESLQAGSTVWNMISGVDFLNIKGMLTSLIG